MKPEVGMCVVSMIFDHYHDKWWEKLQQPPPLPYPYPPPTPAVTPEEVEEFRRLLERAREYDRKNNQPDCELEEKRKVVKDLAERLGVKIDFV